MLKQERRRAGEAEVALKEAGLSLDKKSRSSPILGRTSPIQVEGPVPDSMMSLVKAGKLSASRDSAIGSAVSTHTTGTPRVGSSSSGERSSHSSTTSAHSMVESRSSQDWNAVKAGTTTLCTCIFLYRQYNIRRITSTCMYMLEVSEQALGGIPLDLGMFVKINLLNFNVHANCT